MDSPPALGEGQTEAPKPATAPRRTATNRRDKDNKNNTRIKNVRGGHTWPDGFDHRICVFSARSAALFVQIWNHLHHSPDHLHHSLDGVGQILYGFGSCWPKSWWRRPDLGRVRPNSGRFHKKRGAFGRIVGFDHILVVSTRFGAGSSQFGVLAANWRSTLAVNSGGQLRRSALEVHSGSRLRWSTLGVQGGPARVSHAMVFWGAKLASQLGVGRKFVLKGNPVLWSRSLWGEDGSESDGLALNSGVRLMSTSRATSTSTPGVQTPTAGVDRRRLVRQS